MVDGKHPKNQAYIWTKTYISISWLNGGFSRY